MWCVIFFRKHCIYVEKLRFCISVKTFKSENFFQMPLSDRSKNPDKKKKKKTHVTRDQKIINWILSDILCSFEYVLQNYGKHRTRKRSDMKGETSLWTCKNSEDQYHPLIQCNLIRQLHVRMTSQPSKHKTLQQRRDNVAATSRRCSDVVKTLLGRCVFAGNKVNPRICPAFANSVDQDQLAYQLASFCF